MARMTMLVACLVALASAHDDHENQKPLSGPHESLWYNTLPGDGGTQVFVSQRAPATEF
jgi:agmatinase